MDLEDNIVTGNEVEVRVKVTIVFVFGVFGAFGVSCTGS